MRTAMGASCRPAVFHFRISDKVRGRLSLIPVSESALGVLANRPQRKTKKAATGPAAAPAQKSIGNPPDRPRFPCASHWKFDIYFFH
jgi:hypothetical protein